MTPPEELLPCPRTEAACREIGRSGVDWHHSATLVANFARELERELARTPSKAEEEKTGTHGRKYWVRENPDGTHTLMRYEDERAAPNNAEYQFWCEIQALEKSLVEERHAIQTGREAFERIREHTEVLHGEVGLPAEALVKRLRIERDTLRTSLAQAEQRVRELEKDRESLHERIREGLPNEGGWATECPYCHRKVPSGRLRHRKGCIAIDAAISAQAEEKR